MDFCPDLFLGFQRHDDELAVLCGVKGFAEVWLAKVGHPGNIFINFLHKIELPLIYTLYGASQAT